MNYGWLRIGLILALLLTDLRLASSLFSDTMSGLSVRLVLAIVGLLNQAMTVMP